MNRITSIADIEMLGGEVVKAFMPSNASILIELNENEFISLVKEFRERFSAVSFTGQVYEVPDGMEEIKYHSQLGIDFIIKRKV